MIYTAIKLDLEDGRMTRDYNLYEIWKDLYFQNSNMVDEKVKEDFPSQGVGQILEMNLLFKKMMDETTQRYLEQVNIPTRTDISNISSLIVNVDAKVDELEELIEDIQTKQPNQNSIQRELANVKKDMKSIDSKLNQILTLLETQKTTKAQATQPSTDKKA